MGDPESGSVTNRAGHLPFRKWRTWYGVVEPPGGAVTGKVPLLTLHGGPGIPHGYLDPLAELARGGRDVVFYDQLGCGESTHPHDPSLWTIDLFVEQLDDVRRQLGLQRVHILGQSWGGMLALEYALRRPDGLVGLVLADTASSMPQWAGESARLRAALPEDVRRTLDKHEASGTIDSQEYQDAMMAFYARHVCRVDPMPDCVQRAFSALEEDPEVYFTMWGPNEFTCTGTLQTWDVTDRLGEIEAPTLVVCGRHDEATPAIAETLRSGIAGSRLHVFERSSHLPHVEEPQAFRAVVDEFLTGADHSA